MGSQVMFFDKSKIDLDRPNISITVTDSEASNTGQDYVDFLRNRNNNSAWMTTGSSDSAGTTIEVDMSDSIAFDSIALVKHNFKSFTVEYWDGSNWQDFSTPINETTNSESVSFYTFDEVNTSKIRIVINGTQTADEEKKMFQLIITNKFLTGQLEGWPEIRRTKFDTQKRVNDMLSGKAHIVESIGSFECEFRVREWKIQQDINIVQELYIRRRGVLMWINADDDMQFALEVKGYRKEDFFLVRPTDDYSPDLKDGFYQSGLELRMRIREVIQ